MLLIALLSIVFHSITATIGLLGVKESILGSLGLRDIEKILVGQEVTIEQSDNLTTVSGNNVKFDVTEIDIIMPDSALSIDKNGLTMYAGNASWNWATLDASAALHRDGTRIYSTEIHGDSFITHMKGDIYTNDIWTDKLASELSLINLCKADRIISSLPLNTINECELEMKATRFSEIAKVEYISKLLVAIVNNLNVVGKVTGGSLREAPKAVKDKGVDTSHDSDQIRVISNDLSVLKQGFENYCNTTSEQHSLEDYINKAVSNLNLECGSKVSTTSISMLNETFTALSKEANAKIETIKERLASLDHTVSANANETSRLIASSSEALNTIESLNYSLSNLDSEFKAIVADSYARNTLAWSTELSDCRANLSTYIDAQLLDLSSSNSGHLTKLNDSISMKFFSLQEGLETLNSQLKDYTSTAHSIQLLNSPMRSYREEIQERMSKHEHIQSSMSEAIQNLDANITISEITLHSDLARFTKNISGWMHQHEENTSAAIAVSNSILAKVIREVNLTAFQFNDLMIDRMIQQRDSLGEVLRIELGQLKNELEKQKSSQEAALAAVKDAHTYSVDELEETMRAAWMWLEDYILDALSYTSADTETMANQIKDMNATTEALILDVVAAIEELEVMSRDNLMATTASFDTKIDNLEKQLNETYQHFALQSDLIDIKNGQVSANERVNTQALQLDLLQNIQIEQNESLSEMNLTWWKVYDLSEQHAQEQLLLLENNNNATITAALADVFIEFRTQFNAMETSLHDNFTATSNLFEVMLAAVNQTNENITNALNDSIAVLRMRQHEDRVTTVAEHLILSEAISRIEERMNITSELNLALEGNMSTLWIETFDNRDEIAALNDRLNSTIINSTDALRLRDESFLDFQSQILSWNGSVTSTIVTLSSHMNNISTTLKASIASVMEETRGSITELEDLLAESAIQQEVAVDALNTSFEKTMLDFKEDMATSNSNTMIKIQDLLNRVDIVNTTLLEFEQTANLSFIVIAAEVENAVTELNGLCHSIDNHMERRVSDLSHETTANLTTLRQETEQMSENLKSTFSKNLADTEISLMKSIEDSSLSQNSTINDVIKRVDADQERMLSDLDAVRQNISQQAAFAVHELELLNDKLSSWATSSSENAIKLKSSITELSDMQEKVSNIAKEERTAIKSEMELMHTSLSNQVSNIGNDLFRMDSTAQEKYQSLKGLVDSLRLDTQKMEVRSEVATSRIDSLYNDSAALSTALQSIELHVSEVEKQSTEASALVQQMGSQHQLLATEMQNLTLNLIPNLFNALGRVEESADATKKRHEELRSTQESSTDMMKSQFQNVSQEVRELRLMVNIKMESWDNEQRALSQRLQYFDAATQEAVSRLAIIEDRHAQSSILQGNTSEKLYSLESKFSVAEEQRKSILEELSMVQSAVKGITHLETSPSKTSQLEVSQDNIKVEISNMQDTLNNLTARLNLAEATIERQRIDIERLEAENRRLSRESATQESLELMRNSMQEMYNKMLEHSTKIIEMNTKTASSAPKDANINTFNYLEANPSQSKRNIPQHPMRASSYK